MPLSLCLHPKMHWLKEKDKCRSGGKKECSELLTSSMKWQRSFERGAKHGLARIHCSGICNETTVPQVVCHGLISLSQWTHHIFIPHLLTSRFQHQKSQNPTSQTSECVENNLCSLFRDNAILHSRGSSLTGCSVVRREMDDDTLYLEERGRGSGLIWPRDRNSSNEGQHQSRFSLSLSLLSSGQSNTSSIFQRHSGITGQITVSTVSQLDLCGNQSPSTRPCNPGH